MITVANYMTADPRCIGLREPLTAAHRLMREHGIRHLPVLDEKGHLAGLLSERDLSLLETLRSVDPRQEPVSEAMSAPVYAVPPDAALAVVAHEMEANRYGSAVVVQAGRVVGLFTTTDALRALVHLAR